MADFSSSISKTNNTKAATTTPTTITTTKITVTKIVAALRPPHSKKTPIPVVVGNNLASLAGLINLERIRANIGAARASIITEIIENGGTKLRALLQNHTDH